MPWCFSTRASVATMLSMHPCVSSCLWFKFEKWIQQSFFSFFWICYFVILYTESKEIMTTALLSQDSLKFVVMTAFNTSSGDKAVAMTTFPFQYMWLSLPQGKNVRHNHWMLPYTQAFLWTIGNKMKIKKSLNPRRLLYVSKQCWILLHKYIL